MAKNTGNPISEENIPQVGMHRSSNARYGFWLETSEDGGIKARVNTSAPVNDENFKTLPIVQDYEVDEPQAVTITPTQGGGKLIEDRGMIIKDISIAGTSGYTPRPSDEDLVSGVQPTTSGGNKLPLMGDEEAHARSGYKAFIELRNLFRRYGFIMRYGTQRQKRQTRMHFMDTKLGDFWIIQPRNFRLRRNVNGRTRMTFDYSIKFTTLAPSIDFADVQPLLPEDMELDTDGLQEIGTTQAATGSSATTLGTIGAQAQKTSITDRLRQLNSDIRGVTQTLNLEGLTKVNQYLSVADNFIALFALPALATRDLVSLSVGVLARVENSIEGLLGVYELTADTFNPNSRFWNETYLEARSIFEAVKSRSTIIFGESAGERLARENQKWESARGVPTNQLSGGSANRTSFLRAGGLNNTRQDPIGDPINLRGVRVQKGDSVYTLSQRHLGTVHKYVDIVAINGLVPPFVIDSDTGLNRRPGVLYPGDLVFVPAANTKSVDALAGEVRDALVRDKLQGTVTTVSGLTLTDNTQTWIPGQWIGYTVTINGEDRIITGNDSMNFEINRLFTVTPLPGATYLFRFLQFSSMVRIPTAEELTYGRDILVSFDFGKGMDRSASTILNARGDFATLTGLNNYIQALRLLMATEQGMHIFHPGYGNPMPIGQKMLVSTVQFYKMLLVRSIMMDARTQKVLKTNVDVKAGQPDVLNTRIEILPIGTSKAEKVGLAS